MFPAIGAIGQLKHATGLPPNTVVGFYACVVVGNINTVDGVTKADLAVHGGGATPWTNGLQVLWDDTQTTVESFKVTAGGV